MTENLWKHREEIAGDVEVGGFKVEARDGTVGRVDDSGAAAASRGHLVVDTGFWIFGRKVLIPAAAITSIDLVRERVHVDLTQGELRNAPEIQGKDGVDDRDLELMEDFYRPWAHLW